MRHCRKTGIPQPEWEKIRTTAIVKAMISETRTLPPTQVAGVFGPDLLEVLSIVQAEIPADVYLTGGTVRDLLLGRRPVDIDLTVSRQARRWAAQLSQRTGGTYVELGREEDAARVVWQGRVVDFSSFREGASSIGEELGKRDITLNSMAVRIASFAALGRGGAGDLSIVDPTGGLEDLKRQCVRMVSRGSFLADPLRLLRVFRFAAVLEFSIDPSTLEQVRRDASRLNRVAVERISHELELIMSSTRAAPMFGRMAETTLLWEILPELRKGVGMEQPASHHLDVFAHCLETLACAEQVLSRPESYFPESGKVMRRYLERPHAPVLVKWAALLHDVGKPVTYTIDEDRGGRITFYNHDREGAAIFADFSRRLRWPKKNQEEVFTLIRLHMRPFFLANVQRQGTLSLKACLRLVRSAGPRLPGLFLLAMADALAGKGDGSPQEIEREVATLFARLEQVRLEHVVPVQACPPLLTGRDLIDELHLEPGPLFRKILERVEQAQMEKTIRSRREALALAASLAAREHHA